MGNTVTVSGSVNSNITNTTLNVDGTVDIGNIVTINGTTDVTILNSTLNVDGTVDIGNTVTVSGSVNSNITNTTLNVDGTVDIGNNITIGAVASGVSIGITGNVNTTIQNSTLNISGTVDIGNNITIGAVAGGVSIDVNGTINVGSINTTASVNITDSITLPTDTGKYSINLQENQTNGQNTLTYNPWGFVYGTGVTLRTNSGAALNSECNVQQNGAVGYPTFYFYCYNNTSNTTPGTIVVYLYDSLPVAGPGSTPIAQFSFTPTFTSTQQWFTVTPNIYWNYGSMVVVPQRSTGTGTNLWGVGQPSSFNAINSHFWNGSVWNTYDTGFVGYWSFLNSPPASLPTIVTSPVRIAVGTPQRVATSQTTNGFFATVPTGKKWKIIRAESSVEVNGTNILEAIITIQPSGDVSSPDFAFSIVYNHVTSPVSGNTYVAMGDVAYLPSNSIVWSSHPELYAGDSIGFFILAGNVSTSTSQVWYVESDI